VEGIHEQAEGFAARGLLDAAFQVADGAGTEAGAFGEFFLREPRGYPVLA
jgi:hypothetical protein